MANRLNGVWFNEYGSRMEITVDETGFFSGLYSSHTGEVGTYRVIGLTDPHSVSDNQGVSISIHWRPLHAEGENPDWHMVSGMVGQLQTVDGAEVITLNHLLVQETDHGDNWRSTFIDKIKFTRG
ncbi:avidin/streptavidin family protein [Govanella unica]|uniref:Avidin/streptavidin family protein n=1 Tax=Govanella unica TaxID=2975056 RepID=A0A9X3Z7M7_9PROT|nr:avidin/streptavidin family protein [Govania unica]MDA5194149.1 avidin/streptavidin family protein [Govania unica]